MSLLELNRVSKSYNSDPRRPAVLRDVSLQIDCGELVAVYGARRSGRSTLLRVAGGIESPDYGSVCFAGRDLRDPHHDALGGGIGYCRRSFRSSEGPYVIDHLAIGQVARGTSLKQARRLAHVALERVEVGSCAGRRPAELDAAESVRVVDRTGDRAAAAHRADRRADYRRRFARPRRDPAAARLDRRGGSGRAEHDRRDVVSVGHTRVGVERRRTAQLAPA